MPTNGNQDDDTEKLEREVYDAMQFLGWLFPQTLDDVARLEAEFAENPIELPESLKEPAKVFNGKWNPPMTPPAIPDGAVVENLAMAASNGGEITDEILKQMHRDRAESERNDHAPK